MSARNISKVYHFRLRGNSGKRAEMSQPRDKEFWNLVCGGNLEELRHLLDRVLQQEGADSLRVLLNKKFGQFRCKVG